MRSLKIGMVLSGGGAKGAYQIGFFRALSQLGADKMVTAVSGCSIGALNALLFAGGGEAQWVQAWQGLNYENFLRRDMKRALPNFPRADTAEHSIGGLVSLIHSKAAEIGSLDELLSRGDLAPFSQEGLRELLETHVSFDALSKQTVLWVCAYNMEREQPEYFSLSGLSRSDMTALTLASASIPLIFPPVEYRGCHYCDGGIVPPYSRKRNADKIPLQPLRGAGCDLIIIVYLSHRDKLELDGFPVGTRFLELYPSFPLEAVPGAGTLNLDPETLLANQQMGYNDGLAAVAPLLLSLGRGESLDSVLERHDDYNRVLLAKQQEPSNVP